MTETATRRPPFLAPIREQYDPNADRAFYGHCTSFCIADSPTGRRSGRTVSEHGAYCESVTLLAARGVDLDGGEFALYGKIVQPYVHGVYSTSLSRAHHEALFAMQLHGAGVDPDPDGEPRSVYLSAGELRRMAAAYVRAADAMDRIDVDVNNPR